ncbi:MAG: 2-keto-4-pentenoate hydratase [Caldimonas sp.]
MDEAQFAAAVAELAKARREARAIDAWPEAWRPHDLAEAYRLQAAALRALGPIAAWKVAAVTAAQRASLAVDRPIGAAIPRRWLIDARSAPARLRSAAFIGPKLECEIAFELGADLPPRPALAYTRAEVRAATAAVRLAVEVVDWRVPRGLGALVELADGFNNGALVVGPSHGDWDGIDFAALEIVLGRVHEGRAEEVARGSAATILDGDPFATVVMLANAPPDATRGLLAGDIVTTGSCTGAPPVPGPGTYRAAFGELGSVELVFDGD